MRSGIRPRTVVLCVLGLAVFVPGWTGAQPSHRARPGGDTAEAMQAGPMGAQMRHAMSAVYGEWTFHVLFGTATAGVGFVVYRFAKSRRRRVRAPAGFLSEAVLVVDLVDSTHLATHYGSAVALRSRNALAERVRAAAESRSLTFWETTGDGSLMTFPTVARAVETAVALVRELERLPPDISPGPPLAVRAGVGYGEILLDDGGRRHGAPINKAFRLLGVTPESFAPIAGAGAPGDLPDRNRILLDEEAANELPAAKPPRRFVGFATLKGFSGLHRVYAVDANAQAAGDRPDARAPGRRDGMRGEVTR